MFKFKKSVLKKTRMKTLSNYVIIAFVITLKLAKSK
jgi:hypothetical protein